MIKDTNLLAELMAALGDHLDKTLEDMEQIERRLHGLHDILRRIVDELTAPSHL